MVRAHYGAFSSGDINGVIATLHPEVEIVSADEHAHPLKDEALQGHDEARAMYEETGRLVGRNWVEVVDLAVEGKGVVATLQLHGKVRATGLGGSIPAVHRFTFRDGLISRIETFNSQAWRPEAD